MAKLVIQLEQTVKLKLSIASFFKKPCTLQACVHWDKGILFPMTHEDGHALMSPSLQQPCWEPSGEGANACQLVLICQTCSYCCDGALAEARKHNATGRDPGSLSLFDDFVDRRH
jgi:hypothetical protein